MRVANRGNSRDPRLSLIRLPSSRTFSLTRRSVIGAIVLLTVHAWTVYPALAQCGSPPNEIVAENCLTGNPGSQWDVVGAGDSSIQGFTTDISVNRGGTVVFKVDTPSTNYRIDIYRMGYYGGMGARLVATVQPSVALPQVQPDCVDDPPTGLVDCGNWSQSASWAVPPTATSGVYIAKLVREDPEDGRASHVPFVVRDDSGASDLLMQTSDTTWQAYNTYGGNSLYFGSPAGRAYKVSYNRPFTTRGFGFPQGSQNSWFFNAEYPMVRWLERNGYDVSYFTGVDSQRRGEEILEHEVFLSVGHDEYWSAGQRANVEAAGDFGVHLAFFSGNEMFWKTRWENSIAGPLTTFRTLVTYKETHANAKIDPAPNVWTGTWRDPRFSPPADGGRPENAVTGTIFVVNGETNNEIEVPAADGKMRFWRGTSVATLMPAQTAIFGTGTLGYEWDQDDNENGFRPAGQIQLSSATHSGVPVLIDFGSNYTTGTATHHLTLHRRTSGALVFGAGTVQWSWGLDANHDFSGPAADARMQQATVNLFADMGVQPGSLQAGLGAASASTDTIPPTSTITSPMNGAAIVVNTPVNISGTAADSGGGVVGGIEVSVNGGSTWKAAIGRGSWSFNWTPTTTGTFNLRSRAADDTVNLENPSAGITVIVGNSGSDFDGDGFIPPSDCDNFDNTVFPGAPELCDNQDNDCDTAVDEGNPQSGASCSTGLPGVCGPGTQQCVSGALQCVPNTPSSPEQCNNLDDDCDGTPDDGNPGGGAQCGVTSVGPCQFGVRMCVSGSLQCIGNIDPQPEQCNNADDDCDGTADDGNPGGGAPCSTGQPGVCGPGTILCLGGTLQCDRNVDPSAEVCDGANNDCDGQTDEDTSGAACNTTLPGVCAAGTTQCLAGVPQCIQSTPPTSETCNGLDDDCDGTADDGNPGGGGACTTGLPGVCSAGTFVCQQGALQCVANASVPEICDGNDNDCDGTADDGNPDGGGPCATGLPGACATGSEECQGGTLVCTPPSPGVELCSGGVDEDCDNEVDEQSDCVLCEAANVTTLPEQTKKTGVHIGSGTGLVKTKGTFVLPAAATIDPVNEVVRVRVTDGTGQVAYQGTLPAGSLQSRGSGRTMLFKDPTQANDGLRLVKFNVKRDAVTVKYQFKAKALDLPTFTAGTGTVTVQIGGRCFVDSADACTVTATSGRCE